MTEGRFYFIDDQYYIDYPDSYLMQNKETIHGIAHGRPCFFAFQDKKTGLYWMIPISSQVDKFTDVYNKKIARSGKCDTIVFGEVLGHKKAFLIQNMCPVTDAYVSDMYVDSRTSVPVALEYNLEKELIKKAKQILALRRKGAKLIFPDVLAIEASLVEKM